MRNKINTLRHIATHPITAILLIDLLVMCLFATFAYIGAQTALPGIGAQFVHPSILFIFLFLLYIGVLRAAHATDITPPHTPLRIGALILCGAYIGIANYFYGWIAGAILAGMCLLCYALLMRLYDDTLAS